MWDVQPGIEFASAHLLKQLGPAHRLNLACRYQLWSWLSEAIRQLILMPLQSYTVEDMNRLSYGMFSTIAIAKENISTERMRLAICPPYPKDVDSIPYCDRHQVCRRVWTDKWFGIIIRQICTGPDPNRLPISSLKGLLEKTDYAGMNQTCKKYLVSWLEGSRHMQKEEEFIQTAIDEIRAMFV